MIKSNGNEDYLLQRLEFTTKSFKIKTQWLKTKTDSGTTMKVV